MTFETALVLRIAKELDLEPETVRRVISAVDRDSEYGPLARNNNRPRRLRCKLCKEMHDAPEVAPDKICTTCRPERPADERDASTSVRAWRGGAPGLGKRS